MRKNELKSFSTFPIYPRDSKITTDKRFVSIDNRNMEVPVGPRGKREKNHLPLIRLVDNLINIFF